MSVRRKPSRKAMTRPTISPAAPRRAQPADERPQGPDGRPRGQQGKPGREDGQPKGSDGPEQAAGEADEHDHDEHNYTTRPLRAGRRKWLKPASFAGP